MGIDQIVLPTASDPGFYGAHLFFQYAGLFGWQAAAACGP
jgi:hypothetical protein